MQEWGEVASVEDNGKIVVVRLVRHGACGNCQACGMRSGETEALLRATVQQEVHVGERVRLSLPRGGRIWPPMLMFLVPLLFLIGGLVIGLRVPVADMEQQMVAAIFALAAMAVAFLLLRMLEPLWRKTRMFMPFVVAVADQAPGEEEEGRGNF